jgi:hypothetical protein
MHGAGVFTFHVHGYPVPFYQIHSVFWAFARLIGKQNLPV